MLSSLWNPKSATISQPDTLLFAIPTRALIELLNARIKAFREETQDVFLTPFKGMSKMGAIAEEWNSAWLEN